MGGLAAAVAPEARLRPRDPAPVAPQVVLRPLAARQARLPRPCSRLWMQVRLEARVLQAGRLGLAAPHRPVPPTLLRHRVKVLAKLPPAQVPSRPAVRWQLPPPGWVVPSVPARQRLTNVCSVCAGTIFPLRRRNHDRRRLRFGQLRALIGPRPNGWLRRRRLGGCTVFGNGHADDLSHDLVGDLGRDQRRFWLGHWHGHRSRRRTRTGHITGRLLTRSGEGASELAHALLLTYETPVTPRKEHHKNGAGAAHLSRGRMVHKE